MKAIKLLLSIACVAVATTVFAQDFSDPKYAKWGDTPEVRKENILASSFLKEELLNRNYNVAAKYLQQLLKSCPNASENIYANGASLYKQKISKAANAEERKMFVDSLLLIYDLRMEQYGNHPKRGKAYLMERKAKEILTYCDTDRALIRKSFEEAIDAQVEKNGTADPDFVALYFANLCADYQNDEVDAITVVNAYDANSKFFENLPTDQQDAKSQFETAFGKSGAASCENLEAMFSKRIAAAPNDMDLLNQAFALMGRAKCSSDFYFSIGERCYANNPNAQTALFLANGFQEQKKYDKASQYLREALASETDAAQREKLLTQIGVLEFTTNDVAAAAKAFHEVENLNPQNGLAQFFLAQCYVASARNCAAGFTRDAVYWLAYDILQKAIPLLEADPEVASNVEPAKSLVASYRRAFPSQEECFFQELNQGSGYTIRCGLASGMTTVVRYR